MKFITFSVTESSAESTETEISHPKKRVAPNLQVFVRVGQSKHLRPWHV
jgi:hypothetical protein